MSKVKDDELPKKTIAIVKTEVIATPPTINITASLPSNEVTLVRLDFNGEEVIGSDFTVNVYTYERTYAKLTKGDMPQYKVKTYNNKKK